MNFGKPKIILSLGLLTSGGLRLPKGIHTFRVYTFHRCHWCAQKQDTRNSTVFGSGSAHVRNFRNLSQQQSPLYIQFMGGGRRFGMGAKPQEVWGTGVPSGVRGAELR